MPKIKKPTYKNNSVTFYVFHLPLLLLLLGILTISSFVTAWMLPKSTSTDSNQQSAGVVLGDDSDEDDTDNGDNADDHKDEDEDKDEYDDKNDEETDDNDSEDTEDEEELEAEFEVEDEDSSYENKTKTQERVQNANGTYSMIKTETEGDKLKIETKTYDAYGKLISEEKHEASDEGFESETEDASGNKLKVRVQNTETLIKREGLTGLNNFPLYIDETDGSVYVDTPKGEVKLGVMPQAIIEKAEENDDIDSVEEIEIESDDTTEYSLKVTKVEKLFGVFALEIPSTVYFDAQNGEQVRKEQTFINKVIDFLSF